LVLLNFFGGNPAHHLFLASNFKKNLILTAETRFDLRQEDQKKLPGAQKINTNFPKATLREIFWGFGKGCGGRVGA